MNIGLERDARSGSPVSVSVVLPGGGLGGNVFAKLRGAALVILAAAFLLWPALLDGRPDMFPDTALYFSEAEYLMKALSLVGPGQGVVPADDPTRLPDTPGAPNISAGIDGGRSPVWGGFFYLLERVGRVWGVAYAQAFAAALAVYVLYRAAAPRARRVGYLALMGGLALASSLPVFATLMMPDVFAGVAAVCILSLMACWDRLSRVRRSGVFVLLAFSLMAHGSNPFVAVLVALAGGALLAFSGLGWTEAAKRGAVVLLAAVIAVAGVRAAYQPIQARAGQTIGSPPFLSARVLADGPARVFLRRACDRGQAFALCPFDRQPMENSDQVLWSRRPGQGVFTLSDIPTRKRLEAQDLRFALSAFLADPVGQIAASLRNAAVQLVTADVSDTLDGQRSFVADGYWRRTSLPRIMPDARACLPRGSCRPRLPSIVLSVVEEAVAVAAVLAIAWRLSRPDMGDAWRAFGISGRRRSGGEGDRRRMIRLVLLAGTILLANAVVCGALSGPFPRYQARLVWIAPMVAGLLWARFGAGVACRRGDNYNA